MAYNPSVPKTGNTAAQDYSTIQGNFSQIQDSFSIDHEPLASGGSTEGFHKKISFAEVLTSDPSSTSGQGFAYTKTNNSKTELFYERDTGSAGSPAIPIVPLSAVKAFGSFNSAGTLSFSWNASVSHPSTGIYNVTLTAYAVNSASFGIIVSSHLASSFTSGAIVGYDSVSYNSGTGVASFVINCKSLTSSTGVNPNNTTFAIIQI